jgi:diguanylate cyclase (GGDEF)-like protein/PAS domain S-box-containing protein
METPYHILIVEDVPTDAELNERAIQEVLTPCVFERVETEADFLKALDEFKPDIIISDYSMPSFDGMTALKLTLERTPLTPFIIVTGSMNEDTAVDCMKAGATNYVIKQYLKRLGPAVLHAMEERKIRQERLKAQEDLKESEARLSLASSIAHVGYWEWDPKTGKVIWTDEVYRIFGYEPGSITPGYELFLSWIHPDDRVSVQEAVSASLEKTVPYIAEFRFSRKDGGERIGRAIGYAEFDKEGRAIRLTGAMQNITEIRSVEEALRASEAELHDNYFIQSAINMILSESLINIPLEEILQKSLNMILSIPWMAFELIGSISLVEDDADVLVMKAQSNLHEPIAKLCMRVPFGKCLCGKAAQTQKIEFADHIDERHEICYDGMHPHGHYSVPILFSGKTLGVLNIYLKEGHIRDKKEEDFLRTVADTLSGIIMRKKAEKRIEYLAYYDALTGLPNRNLFLDRLKQGIYRSEHTSKIAAVLITNIDRFKSINDTYGTEVGDGVLNEVAGRLSTAVRKGDTVARLGNDEFGIALLDIGNLDDVIQVMEKIMKYISHPLKVGSDEIALTFSTGISIYPHDSKNPQDLLKSAGLALGIAKKEGRRTSQFYTEDLNIKASEFLLMEKNLYNAIKNEEFLLHYQPYWEINTQKMVGMEALIRWNSKDMGLVSPGKFIPVLEDTGMIIEVGEWILRTAMRQVKEWQNNGYPVVPVSVNMSLVQFRQKNLAEMVKKIMGECGYYPSLLTLEITESAFMQDIEFTRSVLTAMKDIGCSVSIDDFGTGYSSLAHLKRFPVDNLKIDISFIREMVKDPDSASIVMAIINMAHTLQLKTIAEGIETEEQWKFLRLLRCDMGQGFYLSKPLPAEELERFFKQ